MKYHYKKTLHSIYHFLKKLGFFRRLKNHKSLFGLTFQKNHVNLEYWLNKENLGDSLSPVIVDWMLSKHNLTRDDYTQKTSHLYALGSIIGSSDFDAVIWGSGIHTQELIDLVKDQKNYVRYDIRLLRGPVTQKILMDAGYDAPSIYGDPAIIMPYIYTPKKIAHYNVSIIRHMQTKNSEQIPEEIHEINLATTNYKHFLNEIISSDLIITSSLHGIILSEAYGVPAIFYKKGMDNELIKYDDYYQSTGRNSYVAVDSLDEALQVTPMPLPDLSKLRENIINTFPYDLWK